MKPTRGPLVVGIAGIMGAGKSTVARVFQDLGASVVDADAIGRAMLAEPDTRAALAGAFGDGIKDERGEIDSAKLGIAAFATCESAERLDAITRDLLIARIKSRIEELRGSARVIVVDAALLPEWNAKQWLDILIVVDAEEDRSAGRVTAAGRFTDADVRARMKHQLPRSEKASHADIVIPNYGTVEELKARARAVFWTIMGIGGKSDD